MPPPRCFLGLLPPFCARPILVDASIHTLPDGNGVPTQAAARAWGVSAASHGGAVRAWATGGAVGAGGGDGRKNAERPQRSRSQRGSFDLLQNGQRGKLHKYPRVEVSLTSRFGAGFNGHGSLQLKYNMSCSHGIVANLESACPVASRAVGTRVKSVSQYSSAHAT